MDDKWIKSLMKTRVLTLTMPKLSTDPLGYTESYGEDDVYNMFTCSVQQDKAQAYIKSKL